MPRAWDRRNSDQVGPLRRGAGPYPGPPKDHADRGRADPVPEALELSFDPDHAPAGVVQCHLHDQGDHVGIERWRPVFLCLKVHLRATSSRCQRRIVAGVTTNPDQRPLEINLEKAAISILSRRRSRGRGFARFRTAS